MYQLTFWKFFQNQTHISSALKNTQVHTRSTQTQNFVSCYLSYPPMIPNFYQKKVLLLKSEVLLCALEETFTKQSENCYTFYFTDEADVKFVQHQLEKGQHKNVSNQCRSAFNFYSATSFQSLI